MTRRKQLKPRALAKHSDNGDAANETLLSSLLLNVEDDLQKPNMVTDKNEGTTTFATGEQGENYESDNSDCDSVGTYSSELYSSHTSISFPSSNNSTSEMENNDIEADDDVKKEKKDKSKFKSNSYKCQFCEKSFPRLGYLKKHEQGHEDYMPFKCEFCARLFKHKRSRDRHLKLHTGDRRYKCLYCESAFSRSDHLKIHMKTHDSKKAFQCSFCNRGYNTAAALTSHMQNHKKQNELREKNSSPYNFSLKSSESSSTSVIDKRHTTIDALSPRSLKSEDLTETKNSIKCFYCTKANFATLEQLNVHISIMHNHRFPKEKKNVQRSQQEHFTQSFYKSCEYCLMKFNSTEKLFKHIKLIHDTKIQEINQTSPLKDSPNGEAIKRKPITFEREVQEDQPTDLSQSNSKRLKIEVAPTEKCPTAAVKPLVTPDVFLCNQCNASLPSFESFRLHLKSHLEENYSNRRNEQIEMNHLFYNTQKRFVCQQCRDVVFDNRLEYDQHVEQHFTEFLCQECDSSFTKNDDLQNHLFENHVRFKCTVCNETLDSIMSLKLHFAAQHNIRRCSACYEVFRSERDFKNHVQIKHATTDTIRCIFCRVTCSSELEMHFHFLSTHVKQFRCPACSESFHVEFLLDRHLQMHHAANEVQTSAKFSSNDHEQQQFTSTNMPHQPNMIAAQFKEKMLTNDDQKITEANLLSRLNPTMFNLNQFHNQYGKNFNLSTFNEALSIAHRENEERQRIKDIFCSSNMIENHAKNITETRISPKTSFMSKPLLSDKNNNKNKEKNETSAIFKDYESSAEKSNQIIHINSKSGVSLKCAYCELREDFKSRTELENHMKIQHNIAAKHKCSICDEILPSPAVLAEHKLQHCKVITGKCFHCSETIKSVNEFKSHLQTHNKVSPPDLPIHCICCRQILSSDFEITLHAKFHTNSCSTSTADDDRTCALCLNIMEHANVKKICNSCMAKHNFSSNITVKIPTSPKLCNLCKNSVDSEKFQDHLFEHSMENGTISCAICNSIFTAIQGLKEHLIEHSIQSSDLKEKCTKCNARFLYHSELAHHLYDHDQCDAKSDDPASTTIKQEKFDDSNDVGRKIKEEEDDDYIEIEKVTTV